MGKFHYQAQTLKGQRQSGVLEAPDMTTALRLLQRQRLMPIEVKPEGATLASVTGSSKEKNAPSEMVLKESQIIHFTEELCDLLSAGLPLAEALDSMKRRSSNTLRRLAHQLKLKVQDGVAFSDALRQCSKSFSHLYCNIVAAGEASGTLGLLLKRQAEYMQKMANLKGQVISAMLYPAFIIAAGVALGVMFITYLLPKLVGLLSESNKSLPKLVEIFLSLNHFIKQYGWFLLGGMVVLAIVLLVLGQRPQFKRAWHQWMFKVPIFGSIFQVSMEVQLLQTLGNLLQSGLTLQQSLSLLLRTLTNEYVAEKMKGVSSQVQDGSSFSHALQRAGVVREVLVDMVRVGEQTGDMAQAVQRAGQRFDDHLAKTLDRATQLLQPVIMLFMAVMVGGMAWVMVQMVFSTLQEINQR